MGCNKSKDAYDPLIKDGSDTSKPGAKPAAKPKKLSQKTNKAANEMFQDTLLFAATVPLFKRLPKDQYPLLAKACEPVTYKPGSTVIKEGEDGNEFFAIKSGEATVLIGHKTVATLKSGDYFGEESLLHDEPRSASIIALGELKVLKWTREKFQELGLSQKLQFVNRKAVGAGDALKESNAKPPTPKSEEERALIRDALNANANLANILKKDDAATHQIADLAWKEEFKKGQDIIKEGDLDADYFYILQAGRVEIIKQMEGGTSVVASLEKGSSFGELALLYLTPRAATVTVKKDVIVWVIDRSNFKKVLMEKNEEKVKETSKYLDRSELLAPLSTHEKLQLARALVDVHYDKDEAIITQGENGSTFYILYEGEVAVILDGDESTRLEANSSKKEVQVFGERALLTNEPRNATVKVTSTKAKAFALSRADFDALLGPLKDVLEKKAKDETKKGESSKSLKKQATKDWKEVNSSKSAPTPTSKKKPRKKSLKAMASSTESANASVSTESSGVASKDVSTRILRDDLKELGLLGCGGFGAVTLVEHKVTQETYAMKGLSKGFIVKSGMKTSVMNEKNILLMTNSAFVIKLHECYNSAQTLYFLLEPALGGELYASYNKKGMHGQEFHAKFYSSGVVFAFDHLHQRHIIYRDLKPENLLLTDTGQIKLTDMGLAKFVVGTTYTTCGTPDYFAPELISSAGHTQAVDWWTLGILIYELMSGHPPFESDYPMQIYSKVMAGIEKIAFPKKCQGACGDLIKSLLKQNPADRLPMRSGGIKNIKDHEWYKGFDWDKMEKIEMDPPYKPKVKGKNDLGNFFARKEDMPPQMLYKDDGTGWDKDFATC